MSDSMRPTGQWRELEEQDPAALREQVQRLEAACGDYAAALTARDDELRRLREALQNLRDDIETTVAQYDKNGPEFTSEQGNEYYSASFVLGKAEELIADCDAALASQPPPPPRTFTEGETDET